MVLVAPGHAKAAGIVSIFILIFAVVNLGAGIAWVTYGGKDASGIWNGLLVSSILSFFSLMFFISTFLCLFFVYLSFCLSYIL